MRKLAIVLLFSGVAFAQISIIPSANTTGVLVGSGYVKAQTHQVVRTAANVVYIFAVDDSGCLANSSPTAGVIRAYKGSGSQALNASVPTTFTEVDSAHHPSAISNGSCLFNGGVTSTVFTPDVRMDSSGLIHLAYLLPQSFSAGGIIYQTFNSATDTWGTSTQIASNGQPQVGGSTRYGNVALTLDANDHPYVTWASTSSDIQWVAKTASGGTAWTSSASISGSAGTNELYPSMGTAPDGSIHVVWQDDALATHETIRWAKFSSGTWGTVETVTTGDAIVLAAGDDDQSPSIVFDSSSLPHVLFMDGTVDGSDNYVRLRYRTAGGVWTDDSPPSTSGGSPSSSGTWPTGGVGHTPQNYMSASGTEFIFLGHNTIKSPAPFEYQTGVGTSWSAETDIDPCNTTTSPSGEPGCDGAVSLRYDPLRDNNPGIVDLTYYKENDGTSGYSNHGTIWYKAVQIPGTQPTVPILSVSPNALTFSASQGSTNPPSVNLAVTNSGVGALTYSIASDSGWLSVAPVSGTAPQTIQVSASIAGLSAKTYTGHVTVTSPGSQGSPATITVTLIVTAPPPTPAPVLSVSAQAISFASPQGGTDTPTASISVTNTGSGVLSFTATSDATWLTVTPTSGTAPQTVQISALSAGLNAGTYTGHVTVTGVTGVKNSPATVTVTLSVASPPPPSPLLFGDSAVEAQPDSNALGSAEAFQTTATASGTLATLTIYVDSTSTAGQLYAGLYTNNAGNPGTLLAQGNITSITAGAWNSINVPAVGISSGTSYWIAILGTSKGVIGFRDRKAGCSSQGNAQTNLTTLPAMWSPGPKYTDCPISAYGSGGAAPISVPTLMASPNTFSFAAVQGGPNPASANLSIMNTGSGTLTYTASSDAAWLSAAPSSGTAPQSVQVSANTAGLAPNTYTGHISITSPASQGSPATVTVTLAVTPAAPSAPVLSVSPQAVSFNAIRNGVSPTPASVKVTNSGSGTLNFIASSDASWLAVTPGAGNAPSTLLLTATTGSLAAGTYTGHVIVSETGAQDSTKTITVTLNVAARHSRF